MSGLALPAVLWLVAATRAAGPETVAAPPHDREQTLRLADEAVAAGRNAEAIRLLGSAADRFHSVRALLSLARLQVAGRNLTGALASLGAARRFAPNSEDVLGAFAQLSLAVHAPLPAALTLEALTRMHPTVPQHHYLRGVALLQLADASAATESLERARTLEPDAPRTLVALGLALNQQKRYAEAKPALLRSLELSPEGGEALAALAECEEGLDELGPAEEHAERSLARPPQPATAHFVVGLLRMRQQRYVEARDAFEKALSAEPASPRVHYQLSLAFTRLGDDASAKRHLGLYRDGLEQAQSRLRELRGDAEAGGGTTR
jgi:tetratricopeptide (TPR) repeat protein